MSESGKKVVIAFDLFGTLLSTESIAHELSKLYGEAAAKVVAAQWRRYQLEYSWRITCMGLYRPFSELTRAALHHAVAEQGLALSTSDASALMAAYDGLDVFPEIPAALALVQASPSTIDPFIFSNGNTEMVTAAMRTSPTLADVAATLFGGPERLVTVSDLAVFKPERRTYDHLVEQVGKVGQLGDVWVVTANPFDVVGARVAGLNAAWIDRAGKGWVDGLGGLVGGEPSLVVNGVDEAVKRILEG